MERCQLDLAKNLVWNGFKLIDVTMKPTTWGHWDASTLNDNRDWSDGRGINSMQILAFLASANATAAEIGDMATVKLLTDGYGHPQIRDSCTSVRQSGTPRSDHAPASRRAQCLYHSRSRKQGVGTPSTSYQSCFGRQGPGREAVTAGTRLETLVTADL